MFSKMFETWAVSEDSILVSLFDETVWIGVLVGIDTSKEEITHEYAKSSVAIVSSLYEGFGFPVGEAMACATPLVATDVASIPEITGSFAQLIPAEDADAIYQGIKNIFQNPEQYKLQAEKGRQHIIENFNWIKIGHAYEELLYKTINNFQC